jgi:glycine/D-amino acid oxidase-like deaminating enzyme
MKLDIDVAVRGNELSGMEKHWDVLVVGAGIIGLSTAYHIKKDNSDLSVLMVDRNAAAAQADTRKTMGGIRDTFSSETNRLLAKSSIEFYQHVQNELHFNLNLQLIGYLWLLTEREFKTFEPLETEMRKQGVRLRTYDRKDLASLIPELVLDPKTKQSNLIGIENIYKALQGLDCGIVSPELIAKFYEEEFKKQGGELQFNTEVKSLCLEAKNKLDLPGEPHIWQEKVFSGVKTSRRFIKADTIIVATGARTSTLLDPIGIDCLIKPKKRQVFQIKSPAAEKLINTKGFNESNTIPFTILPKSGVCLRPIRGEKSFWVTAEDDLGRGLGYEEEPMPEESYFTYGIYPILTEYFPYFANIHPANSWAGFYDVNSIDSQPIIDRVHNCILVVGTSGSGIIKADAVGRMAAAIFKGNDEATLYGGRRISTRLLRLTNRSVTKEELVV